jgi:rubrerythrin
MKPADAIALAMKKEEEAMVQYKQMAESCSQPEKKQVFLDLAAMEQGHKQKMENAFVDIGYPEVW